jgi:acyl carrier protein
VTDARRDALHRELLARLADKLAVNARRIGPSTRLTEDLGIDSATAIELLVELEEAYGVCIDDIEASRLATVGQLADLLIAKGADATDRA